MIEKRFLRLWAGCLLGLIGFWGWWTFQLPIVNPNDIAQMGQRGDAYGGLNAFFSGLAWVVIFLGMLFQREELQLQREELKLSREVLSKTAEAQEEHVRILTAEITAMAEARRQDSERRRRQIAPILVYVRNEIVTVSKWRMILRNVGGLGLDVAATGPRSSIQITLRPEGAVATGGELEMEIKPVTHDGAIYPIQISCRDVEGEMHSYVLDNPQPGTGPRVREMASIES